MLAGGEAVRLEGGQHLVRVAAEHGRHAGGGDRTGLCHGAAAVATSDDGLLVGDDPGERGGRELAHRVAGEDGTRAGEVSPGGEERRGGDEPGGDDERLRDRGVLDRVGVGLRAVCDEVETGGLAERGQLLTRSVRVLEPRGEEAGGLGALSGADDR